MTTKSQIKNQPNVSKGFIFERDYFLQTLRNKKGVMESTYRFDGYELGDKEYTLRKSREMGFNFDIIGARFVYSGWGKSAGGSGLYQVVGYLKNTTKCIIIRRIFNDEYPIPSYSTQYDWKYKTDEFELCRRLTYTITRKDIIDNKMYTLDKQWDRNTKLDELLAELI